MLDREHGGETERDPERERGAADHEVGRRSRREPQRSDPPRRAEVEADDAIEEHGCEQAADRAQRHRPYQRAEHRRQDAVVERGMPAVPLHVEEHDAVALDEIGAEDLGGEIRAAPAEDEDRHRECRGRGRRDARRQPTATRGCGGDRGGRPFGDGRRASHLRPDDRFPSDETHHARHRVAAAVS